MRKKSIITTIIVLVVTFFATAYISPQFFNRKIEEFNDFSPFEIERRFRETEFELGLDLQGGASLLYQADLEGVPDGEQPDRMRALRDLVERRVDHFGIGEPLVQVRGDRLAVELPGVRDQEEAIKQIGETPFLEFRVRIDDEEKIEEIENKRLEVRQYLGNWFRNDYEENFEKILIEDLPEEEIEDLEKEIEDWELAFESVFGPTDPELTGRFLQDADVRFDETSGRPAVTLRFDSEGAEVLRKVTAENKGELLATYLDGRQIQQATIQTEIPRGEAQISGNLTAEEAREISRDLQIGALPVPIEVISQRTIGPDLGRGALESSVRAGAIGLVAVLVFMIFYYKLLGFLASLSLLIYVAFVLFAFKILGVTLTLSGIAGFVLSIGMAIDANILIFSRIREEIDNGKSFDRAVEDGFSRAWPSIRDGNLTTIVVALILFFVSTSFVQGFATVLIIGILISLFTAMVITRSFIFSFSGTKLTEIKNIWI